MSEPSSRPLACLDANIFLAVLIPEVTRALVMLSLGIHAIVRKNIFSSNSTSSSTRRSEDLRPSQYR